MKKTMLKRATILAFAFASFTACNNDAADSEKTNVETTVKSDTSKTKVKVSDEGVSVDTRGGTQVSIGQEGGEVKTKDLDLQVKPGKN